MSFSRPQRATSPERRIEVEIESLPGGGREVVLRDLSYGPGIGWYAQKTIRLDAEQADALRRALCCARAPRLEGSTARPCGPRSAREQSSPDDSSSPGSSDDRTQDIRPGVIVPLEPHLRRD